MFNTLNLDLEVDHQVVSRVWLRTPFRLRRWVRSRVIQYALLTMVKLVENSIAKQASHNISCYIIIVNSTSEESLTVQCE